VTTFAPTVLRIATGPLAWALHFGALYAATAFACARGDARTVPWVIGIATLAAAGACAWVIVAEWRRRDAFESWLAAALAAFALVAILWQALPVLLVPICR
jgi:hypothetical protein